jgi:hypothetical protein
MEDQSFLLRKISPRDDKCELYFLTILHPKELSIICHPGGFFQP